MGGFLSASSSSRSSADSSRQTLQAGDNSVVQLVRGGGKKSTTLSPGATQIKVGKGSVTIQQTDAGAIAAAQTAFMQSASVLEDAVKSQADTTAAAIGSLGKLGETRVTGGENLALEGVSKNTLYIVGGVVAVIVALFFLKR